MKAIPVQEHFQIGKGRGIGMRNPQRNVFKQIQMCEMILMPMTEPDGLDAVLIPDFFKPSAVGSRIDENACPVNIDGMAKGVFSFIFTGDEPDGAEMPFFHDCSPVISLAKRK
jgi:hypothetical protein